MPVGEFFTFAYSSAPLAQMLIVTGEHKLRIFIGHTRIELVAVIAEQPEEEPAVIRTVIAGDVRSALDDICILREQRGREIDASVG